MFKLVTEKKGLHLDRMQRFSRRVQQLQCVPSYVPRTDSFRLLLFPRKRERKRAQAQS